MKTMLYVLLFVLPLFFVLFSAGFFAKRRSAGKPIKKTLRTHLLTLAVFVFLIAGLAFSVSAAEADGTDAAAQAVQDSSRGMTMLAAGLAMGLSGIGGGIAVGSSAPAAIAATSENPQSFAKFMIFVVLGEAIALYGFVISILIMNS